MDERRRLPRCIDPIVVVHQCVVTHLGRETWLSASAVDLSARGVSLVLNDSLDAGESVYLLASIQPEGKVPRDLSVNGITAYCRPVTDGHWRVGLQFGDLTAEEVHDLAVYLDCPEET